MSGFLTIFLNELLSACTIGSFSGSLASNSKGPMECVSLNNLPCQAIPTLVNINSNESLFLSIYFQY